MRKIDKPNDYTALEAYTTCLGNISDEDLKNRLLACTSLVTQASLDFDRNVCPPRLHTIPTIDRGSLINGNVKVRELKEVYTLRMVPKDGPGRPIYEAIKSLAPSGKCPLCAHRDAATLDHHLPKSKFPLLSVTPLNLVPACWECNTTKKANELNCAEHQTLHPYYDDIENDLWLGARVIEKFPPSIEYFVQAVPGWEPILLDRVKHHFKVLELNDLYSSNASCELSEMKKQLTNIFARAGVEGVKAHLLESEDSCGDVNKNSWRTVLYRTIANNDWFCDRGWEDR